MYAMIYATMVQSRCRAYSAPLNHIPTNDLAEQWKLQERGLNEFPEASTEAAKAPTEAASIIHGASGKCVGSKRKKKVAEAITEPPSISKITFHFTHNYLTSGKPMKQPEVWGRQKEVTTEVITKPPPNLKNHVHFTENYLSVQKVCAHNIRRANRVPMGAGEPEGGCVAAGIVREGSENPKYQGGSFKQMKAVKPGMSRRW
ncbi:hypothetical protein R3P38DRAFT_3375137 [Favolaschia claudopus]|uniref:Uncharacterized protein n=1 Tax=Favolaschia claudopus TaxID=2862362 RepID=A0AAV9ZIV6_9AGAR